MYQYVFSLWSGSDVLLGCFDHIDALARTSERNDSMDDLAPLSQLDSQVMTNSSYVAIEEVEDEPLLQGDLFKWTNVYHQRPWATYGVVVTADCDLVKAKTRGMVSYIPALLMEDYIWHHWREGKFERALEAAAAKFCARINTRLEKLSGSTKSISQDAIIQWLDRVGAEGLFDELSVTDNGQRKELTILATELGSLQALVRTDIPDLDLLQTCFCLKHKNKKIEPGDLSALADDIQSSISSLPGDVFYLPLDTQHQETGLFLMLRHIQQLDIAEISVRVADMTLRDARAQRLGRITAPYRYAITQNLARVFSDIGLPSAYEERRDLSSRRFFKVPS